MPITQLSPALADLVSPDAPITELGNGYGGDAGPAEGPLWWQEGGYLLFSDIGNNRRMRWTPDAGVSLVMEPTNRANGLTRDPAGRLLACEHETRRVTRTEPDGSLTVIANSYRGRRLNRPTTQRLRLIPAENIYSPIPEIDPSISHLEPWLTLFGKFHSACQDHATGPMFQEAIKRYISAAEIARYSRYPITQTWAALEAISKVKSGKTRGNIKTDQIKKLAQAIEPQLKDLPQPYNWHDPDQK